MAPDSDAAQGGATAPDPAPLPDDAYPDGIRAFRAGDEAAILPAMLAAHDRGELEGVNRHFLEESVERFVAEPWIVAVAEDAGRVAGWVAPLHDDLSVVLEFRRRGHGRRLVAAGRVLARHNGLPRLRVWCPRRPASEAFAQAVGLAYHSSLWLLRRAEGAAVLPPAFGADVRVRWLEPGTDDAAFVALVNEIFLDHPSPLVLEPATIRRVHGRPGFDPTTILLAADAADPERLVGFCRVGRYEDDDGAMAGEVKLLGVRRGARGRGLGRELLRWGVDDLGRRGVDRIVLSVEGENEGALRLYEAEGFRPDTEWPHWVAPPIS